MAEVRRRRKVLLRMVGQVNEIEARFWAKVDVREDDECWPWLASTCRGGYGQFGLGHGKLTRAHRYVWSLTNGPIPEGLWVLHSCDSPSCCNPSHLFAGTRQANVDDMCSKRRHWAHKGLPGNRGVENGRAKLVDADVLRIRHRFACGESQTRIARDFPVSRNKIGQIVRRESWTHVP